MPDGLNDFRGLFCISCLAAAIMVSPRAAAADAEKVLHLFQGGQDGAEPAAGLIMNNAGNIYGTTVEGGGGMDCNDGSYGCGTVFQIVPDGTETVLHAFAGGCDGAFPQAGLVVDKGRDMYGTTEGGGTCNYNVGFGTVYKITADGSESVLYAFKGGGDGEYPSGDLAVDRKGNLYGAASGGEGECSNGGCGLVFKVTPKGKKTAFYAFQGGSNGDGPYGDVIRDKTDNLYGTTLAGGGTGCGGTGCGTVFKITPEGDEAVLYAFQGGSDGWNPQNGVIEDGAGDLYGTTAYGGVDDDGVVFKVTPGGSESVLYSFQYGTGGYDPEAGVILDKAGNLYGTTTYGGTGCGRAGCGVVYELAPNGTETVLYSFKKRRLGRNPAAALLLGKHGDLYGTTLDGGDDNNGVVFELKQ